MSACTRRSRPRRQGPLSVTWHGSRCASTLGARSSTERPHEALSYDTPASLYRPSSRRLPDVLPEPQYPGHFEVRWVSKCGTYKWKRRQLFISQALGHEWIGFEEVGDGVWSVWFYDRLLARLDERDFKLRG